MRIPGSRWNLLALAFAVTLAWTVAARAADDAIPALESATPRLDLAEAFPDLDVRQVRAAQYQVAIDGDFDARLVWQSEAMLDNRFVVCVGPLDGPFLGEAICEEKITIAAAE